jgi:hypothetical protein
VLLLTGACSEPPEGGNYRDIAAGAERSQEHFRCTDGSRLLADFSADRRDLRLRWNESATVIALSAPAPNLTFVGEDMNILFREDRAFVEQVNAPKRSCRRVD